MDEWQYSPDWSEQELIDTAIGFVYMFYFPDTDEVYFGSKQMYRRVKDIKRLKENSQENGWRAYSSSSNVVNRKIDEGERYVRTILWGFETMKEVMLVEAILILTQGLKSNCINLAIMHKARLPNSKDKKRLFGIVQQIFEWVN